MIRPTRQYRSSGDTTPNYLFKGDKSIHITIISKYLIAETIQSIWCMSSTAYFSGIKEYRTQIAWPVAKLPPQLFLYNKHAAEVGMSYIVVMPQHPPGSAGNWLGRLMTHDRLAVAPASVKHHILKQGTRIWVPRNGLWITGTGEAVQFGSTCIPEPLNPP